MTAGPAPSMTPLLLGSHHLNPNCGLDVDGQTDGRHTDQPGNHVIKSIY
jgi:hypothetical protein